MSFAIVLSDAVQYLIYLAFFRVDFSHARIAIAAVLPLCVLAAVFVRELFAGVRDARAPADPPSTLPFVAGAMFAIVGVLLIDILAPAVAGRLVRPGRGRRDRQLVPRLDPCARP